MSKRPAANADNFSTPAKRPRQSIATPAMYKPLFPATPKTPGAVSAFDTFPAKEFNSWIESIKAKANAALEENRSLDEQFKRRRKLEIEREARRKRERKELIAMIEEESKREEIELYAAAERAQARKEAAAGIDRESSGGGDAPDGEVLDCSDDELAVAAVQVHSTNGRRWDDQATDYEDDEEVEQTQGKGIYQAEPESDSGEYYEDEEPSSADASSYRNDLLSSDGDHDESNEESYEEEVGQNYEDELEDQGRQTHHKTNLDDGENGQEEAEQASIEPDSRSKADHFEIVSSDGTEQDMSSTHRSSTGTNSNKLSLDQPDDASNDELFGSAPSDTEPDERELSSLETTPNEVVSLTSAPPVVRIGPAEKIFTNELVEPAFSDDQDEADEMYDMWKQDIEKSDGFEPSEEERRELVPVAPGRVHTHPYAHLDHEHEHTHRGHTIEENTEDLHVPILPHVSEHEIFDETDRNFSVKIDADGVVRSIQAKDASPEPLTEFESHAVDAEQDYLQQLNEELAETEQSQSVLPEFPDNLELHGGAEAEDEAAEGGEWATDDGDESAADNLEDFVPSSDDELNLTPVQQEMIHKAKSPSHGDQADSASPNTAEQISSAFCSNKDTTDSVPISGEFAVIVNDQAIASSDEETTMQDIKEHQSEDLVHVLRDGLEYVDTPTKRPGTQTRSQRRSRTPPKPTD